MTRIIEFTRPRRCALSNAEGSVAVGQDPMVAPCRFQPVDMRTFGRQEWT